MGGFELRKWLSNEPEILRSIPSEHLASQPSRLFEKESHFAILEMRWQPFLDSFQCNTLYTIPSVENTAAVLTKRMVASKIVQLFDRLGLLGPVIITEESSCKTSGP